MKRIQIILAVILSLSLLGVLSAFAVPQAIAPTFYTTFIAPTPLASPNPQAPTGPPLSLTLFLLCFCLLFLAIIGLLILGFVVRKENIKEMNKAN